MTVCLSLPEKFFRRDEFTSCVFEHIPPVAGICQEQDTSEMVRENPIHRPG